jgi:hypothetical protein
MWLFCIKEEVVPARQGFYIFPALHLAAERWRQKKHVPSLGEFFYPGVHMEVQALPEYRVFGTRFRSTITTTHQNYASLLSFFEQCLLLVSMVFGNSPIATVGECVEHRTHRSSRELHLLFFCCLLRIERQASTPSRLLFIVERKRRGGEHRSS